MRKVSKISEAFKQVKHEWFKDLAVIDLEGMAEEEKTRMILEGIRQCVEKNDWKIVEDTGAKDTKDQVAAEYDYGGGKIFISVSYSKSLGFIEICAYWGDLPPEDYKAKPLVEMLNLLNARFSAWHLVVQPETKMIGARSGIFVTNYLNLQVLFLLLKYMMLNMYIYLGVIKEFLASDKAPEAILAEHDEKFRMEAADNPDLFK